MECKTLVIVIRNQQMVKVLALGESTIQRSSTFARNPKLHKDVEVDGRKNPPHLGDALSHGLLVDELLPRLVRGGAPLR
jgi:hypothetical protein